MNRHTQRLAVIAALAVTVGALGACNSSGPGASPTPTPSSPSPTKTKSQAELDAAAAGEAVVQFWKVVDVVGADPKSKIEDLNNVARGDVNLQWTKNLFDRRVRGERFIGHTSVEVLSSTPAKAARTHEVGVCLDVSKLNIVDKSGKSIVPANRQPRIGYKYQVVQDAATEKWYVSTEGAQGSC
ncbi:MAG: hypothetical protein ACRCYU_20575 [Nocardioides sp.]